MEESSARAARVCVVGVDGSDASRRALDWARDRVGEGGRIVAVHAYHPPPQWLGTPYWGKSLREHQEFGKELLAEIDTTGTPAVEPDLLEGPPATALVDAAAAHGADEIVIGSHGHGHRHRQGRVSAALGSVALTLLQHADRPVVVIPREDH